MYSALHSNSNFKSASYFDIIMFICQNLCWFLHFHKLTAVLTIHSKETQKDPPLMAVSKLFEDRLPVWPPILCLVMESRHCVVHRTVIMEDNVSSLVSREYVRDFYLSLLSFLKLTLITGFKFSNKINSYLDCNVLDHINNTRCIVIDRLSKMLMFLRRFYFSELKIGITT